MDDDAYDALVNEFSCDRSWSHDDTTTANMAALFEVTFYKGDKVAFGGVTFGAGSAAGQGWIVIGRRLFCQPGVNKGAAERQLERAVDVLRILTFSP